MMIFVVGAVFGLWLQRKRRDGQGQRRDDR
jgi:hypothetical protein